MTVAETSQFLPEEPVVELRPAEPTSAQTSEVPTAESEPQAEPEQKTPNPAQKRIDQLTWQKHEAERRYNAAIMQQQEMAQRLAQYEAAVAESNRRANQPKIDQFSDLNEFQRAIEAHNQQYIAAEREKLGQQQRAYQQQLAQQQYQQFMQTKVNEAKTQYADFEDVVNNPDLPPLAQVNPPVLDAILQHENFAGLAYYMGKNPEEAKRIASMQPARAILEVGKIAARLERKPRTSNAPPPPGEVRTSKSSATKDPKDMTPDEYYDHITKGRKRRGY